MVYFQKIVWIDWNDLTMYAQDIVRACLLSSCRRARLSGSNELVEADSLEFVCYGEREREIERGTGNIFLENFMFERLRAFLHWSRELERRLRMYRRFPSLLSTRGNWGQRRKKTEKSRCDLTRNIARQLNKMTTVNEQNSQARRLKLERKAIECTCVCARKRTNSFFKT